MRLVDVVVPALAAALLACGGASKPQGPAAAQVVVPGEPPRLPPQVPLKEVVFEGMCDASGAVVVNDHAFIVADDEDNILRTYDADRGGKPIAANDVSPAIGLPLRGKKQPAPREMDLEGGTKLGDRAYWITSHGNNKKGKRQEERLHFFATNVPGEGVPVDLVGQPYVHLIDDLIRDPRLAAFDLAASASLAPKAPGGLNIEGLTSTPEGTLMLGFRSPVPGGKALLVPILNGAALVDGTAETAQLGDPILLDLDGQGIRSLSWWRGRYLIAAGEAGDGGISRLLFWDGDPTHKPEASPLRLSIYNPEGFYTPEGRTDEIMLLSDDGTIETDGVPCKDAAVEHKRFRGVWIPVP
jgi:hypothetical protein